MPLSPGDRLGPYEILAVIGEGGMGEVWKARDTRLDRIVALKISKAQFTERFEREARSIAALNHPHICQLYDVGPNYLVMEFVEGSPLKGPLPVEKAAEYAGQILDALDTAHHKGITHRDLKPANILVTKQGIKLLDFGLAKLATAPLAETDRTVTQPLTAQGQILGTLQYMSPEQLQGKEADARSDLFSFGCVLYEMLTGKRAFDGASPASVIAAILERQPAPLAEAPPLDRIVRRALAKDPDQRFQTARDLKAALNWALEQPPGPTVGQARGLSKPITIATAAAALVLVAVGAWALARFRQSPADERIFRLEVNPPEGGRFAFGTNVHGISLSPDGKIAAFVAAVNGKTALYVRPLDDSRARPLPGTDGAGFPFWSPDSKSIGFVADGKLQRVDLAGGTPLTICDMPSLGRGAAWSEDGYIVFGTLLTALFRVPAAGGTPTPLTMLDASRGEVAHRWPQLLPGGSVLYWVQSGKPEQTGIYASSLTKPGERVQLLAAAANALYAPGGDGKNYLLWLRGGALVAQEFDVSTLKLVGNFRPVADPVSGAGNVGQMDVAASANGLLLYSSANIFSQLTWLDRSGKILRVLGEPAPYEMFRLSPDGRRAVFALNSLASDLWLMDTERGVASRFTSRPGLNWFPVWSPDGRNILFGSGLSTSTDLFRKEVGGAGMEERVRSNETFRNPLDWSRDGRWLLWFEIRAGTQRDLWVLPVTPEGKDLPGAQRKLYLRTPANEWQGRFSPEPSPHWVAYQSDESGRYEVYVNSFPEPGSKTRISTAGGMYPQWGPGGRELFYVSAENNLMSVSVKLGADSVEPAAPHELFPLPALDNGLDSPYDVAPDGQRFLVRTTLQQQAAQPLNVIVNWAALRKQGAAAQ